MRARESATRDPFHRTATHGTESNLEEQSHPPRESPHPTVEPSAEMSIEIFSERHPSVRPPLDPHPPAPSAPPSLETGRRARLQHRKLRHQEGRRGNRPLLQIPPMTQLARPGDRETPIVGERSIGGSDAASGTSDDAAGTAGRSRDIDRGRETDRTVRCGIRYYGEPSRPDFSRGIAIAGPRRTTRGPAPMEGRGAAGETAGSVRPSSSRGEPAEC
jgi:hypothetical protein